MKTIAPVRKSVMTLLMSFSLAVFIMPAGAGTTQSSKAFVASYDYDARDRLIRMNRPDGIVVRYEYSESGRLLAQEACRYNDGGRLEPIDEPEARTTYMYDDNGNIIEIANGTGKTSFFYDAHDRPVKATYDYEHLKKSVIREYDPWGRVSELRVEAPDGAVDYRVGYSYDMSDRLRSIEADGDMVRYDYDASDRMVTRMLPDGTQSTWKYGESGTLGSIKHTGDGGKTLASFAYEYDEGDRIVAVEERSGGKQQTVRYQYGGAERLVRAAESEGDIREYRYDDAGRRASIKVNGEEQSRVLFDDFGRMETYNGQPCTYDALGNLTSYISGYGKKEFSYNLNNMLKAVRSEGKEVEYHYDATGLLIGRTCQGQHIAYVPDPFARIWRPLYAYGRGDYRARWLWHGERPLAETIDGTREFLLSDHLHTPRVRTSQDGDIMPESAYTPFGERRDPVSATTLRTGFSGLFYDTQASVYLTRSRTYDPALRSFLQRDPVPDFQQQPLKWTPRFSYAYCGDDPVNYVDLQGTERQRATEGQGFWDSILDIVTPLSPREQGFYEGYLKEQYESDKYLQEEGVLSHVPSYDEWKREHSFSPWGWFAAQMKGDSEPSRSERFSDNISAAVNPFRATRVNVRAAENPTEENLAAVKEFNLKKSKGLVGLHGLYFLGAGANSMLSAISSSSGIGAVQSLYDFGENVGRDSFVFSLGNALENYNRMREEQPKSPKILVEPGGLEGPGGPSGPNGGGVGLEDTFHESLNSLGDQFQPKGVRFDKPAEFVGDIGAIEGVYFDPDTKEFALIGDGDLSLPPMRMQDFIVALHAVYSADSSGYPEFSLDPKDRKNPAGEFLKPVYRPMFIEGTHMGDVMLRADWVLKHYAMGVAAEYDGTILGKRCSSVPTYASYMERVKRSPEALARGAVCSRFWIVARDIKLARSGDTIVFRRAKMGVKAQRMDQTAGGLRDSAEKRDVVAQAFANDFTAHYDRYADESPVLEEVREAAKVVAIVMWLKEQGLGVNDFDIDWAEVPRMPDYEREPIHSVSVAEAAHVWGLGSVRLQLIGGVKLAPRLKSMPAPASVASMGRAIDMPTANGQRSAVWTADLGDKAYCVSTLPILAGSKELLDRCPVTVKDGITYAADAQHRVRHAYDRWGNTATFDYDDESRLTQVRHRTAGNWRLHARLGEGDGKEIGVRSPVGHEKQYSFDAQDRLMRAAVDGRTTMRCAWEGDSVEIEHLSMVMDRFSDIGNITGEPRMKEKVVAREKIVTGENSYSYSRTHNGATEIIEARHSEDSATIRLPEGDKLEFQRMDDNTVVSTGPAGKITYEYAGADGPLRKVTRDSGDYIEFPADEKTEDGLDIVLRTRRGDAEAWLAAGDGALSVRGLDGTEITQRYDTESGRLERVTSPFGTTRYEYENNRLAAVRFPGGVSKRFAWREGIGASRLTVWRESAETE